MKYLQYFWWSQTSNGGINCGQTRQLRDILNVVWPLPQAKEVFEFSLKFFLPFFWKYCQKKKVVHPSSLLGCSEPSERFPVLNYNIFGLFVCWKICFTQLYCLSLCISILFTFTMQSDLQIETFEDFLYIFNKYIAQFLNLFCQQRIILG